MKKFLKATIFSTTAAITLFLLTLTYLLIMTYTVQQLKNTELTKLLTISQEQLAAHKEEAIQTAKLTYKIYLELFAETIAYLALAICTFVFFQGNTTTTLLRNKMMTGKETKVVAKNMAIIITTAFALIAAIVLLGKMPASQYAFIIITPLIYLLLLMMTTATITKQKKFSETIVEAIKGIKKTAIPFLTGIAALTATLTILLMITLTETANSTIIAIACATAIGILNTWITKNTLKALRI